MDRKISRYIIAWYKREDYYGYWEVELYNGILARSREAIWKQCDWAADLLFRLYWDEFSVTSDRDRVIKKLKQDVYRYIRSAKVASIIVYYLTV